jgi:hypothetical protein
MRKLLATTALACLLSGPALALTHVENVWLSHLVTATFTQVACQGVELDMPTFYAVGAKLGISEGREIQLLAAVQAKLLSMGDQPYDADKLIPDVSELTGALTKALIERKKADPATCASLIAQEAKLMRTKQ